MTAAEGRIPSTEAGAASGSDAAAAPAGPPARVLASPWRLAAVLGGGGAVAGLLLVVAHVLTRPAIEAHAAQVLAGAVREVLGLSEVDAYETLWFAGGALTAEAPADARGVERAFLARRADGSVAGVALLAAEPGFTDDIRLLFGWDPESRRILGLRILSQKETPGLGDAIAKDPSFVARFRGRTAPVRAVRPGAGRGSDDEVDTITGATVSSRAVVRIVDHAVERWAPRLAAWRTGGAR